MSDVLMDLSGAWHLAETNRSHGCTMMLPGDGVSALHAAGLIPDPYFGANELACRWIAERDWTATRRFEAADGRAELVVSGLDTVAEIRLNGVTVLSSSNAFRIHRVPVNLAEGENTIVILFQSSVAEAARLQAEQPFFVPWHQGNCPIPNGNMLRKPQCDFGWDWNIALAPFGVTDFIRIEKQAAQRVTGIVVDQALGEDAIRVDVTARISGAKGLTARITLCGMTVETAVSHGAARASFRIGNPDLWWPNGLGGQPLHDLTITCGDAVNTRAIGLRELKLVSEPDAAGRSFGFQVNGVPVFARGANWIPADALPGRVTREGTEDLLQSAIDANMNMIRVWGGGRYEPDWFYDICDRLGLMVWQDFMFSCHLYPSTPAFLDEVSDEAEEAVLRIGHHACLALWCGDNELIGALTWYEESRKNRDRYLVSYDRLNRTIETALKKAAPRANWWPSSPSPGPMSFGDAWHDDSSGDMHFWSVWHEGRDFDHYRDVSPRFCSEFGFQSYPSMDVIRRFAHPSNFNIAAPVMEAHQKNAGGNARIAETMFRYFRFPKTFEDFVYLSQVQQGVAIKTAVTHWRSLKPHCMGALFWQLNDTWPVCSWASLDHGGGWKLLHHMAREFFAAVMVTVVPQTGGWRIMAVNDGRGSAELTLAVSALSMDGRLRPLGAATGAIATNAALALLAIEAGELHPDEVIHFAWQADGAVWEDVFAPQPWKGFDLKAPMIRHAIAREGNAWRITLDCVAPAFFVAVEADCEGRFSRNAFPLLPGTRQSILFTPKAGAATPRFTIRDLHSATMA
jgi:beta-mannosidase